MNKLFEQAVSTIGQFAQGVPIATLPDHLEVAAASALKIDQVLRQFAQYCYQESHGYKVNLNGVRIPRGVAVPWGYEGKAKRDRRKARAVLSMTERAVVRYRLGRSKPAVWYYVGREWCVNLAAYPTLEDALIYVERFKMDGSLYLRLSQKAKDTRNSAPKRTSQRTEAHEA